LKLNYYRMLDLNQRYAPSQTECHWPD